MSDADAGKQFIEGLLTVKHFGVKGMHWGVRRSTADRVAGLDKKIGHSKAGISESNTAIKNVKSHIDDVNKNGIDAELFKKSHITGYNAKAFETLNGKTRGQALQDHKDDLQTELEDHQSARQFHTARVAHLESKKAKILSK